MNATVRLDKSGRILLPKSIREHLELQPACELNLEIVGDRIVLTEKIQEAKIVWRNGRRAIAGWEGFDAAKAVREAREDQIRRLEAPFRKRKTPRD